jgi:hypothetical protein
MGRFVYGLLIRGLSVGGSPNPTLFTDGDLDASTIPAELSPLSSSTQIKAWLVPGSLSGARANIDLRDPLVNATAPQVRLQDDATGTLAALLEGDPGNLNTRVFTMDNATSFTAAATTINVTGSGSIATGDVLWLGAEALYVSATSTTVSGLATIRQLTVTRGACGSKAKVHTLRPDDYPPGDDGSREALTVYSRAPFDSGIIEASLYCFAMSDSNPSAVSSCVWAWHGFVRERPREDGDFTWTVSVEHASRALADFVVPGTKDLELSRCVSIVFEAPKITLAPGSAIAKEGVVPHIVKFNLTRYEAERLFGEALHIAHSPQASSSLVTALSAKLTPNGKISHEVVGEVGGYRYVWKLESLTYASANRIEALGTLIESEPGASTKDNPVAYPGLYVNDSISMPARNDGLNQGFIYPVGLLGDLANTDRVRTEYGETKPKITLRRKVTTTFLEALLYVTTSGHGGSGNGSYDLLFGGWPQLDPAWLNTGSAPGSALSVSEGTSAILELNALLSEPYDYFFTPGDSLGTFLRNELLLHCCLFSFVPSTGKLAARLWSRKRSTETALNPVIWPDGEVARDDRLPEIRALILERGFDRLNLEFKYKKPLLLPEGRAKDLKSALTIRLWKMGGGRFQDEEIASGPLARLVRAIFVSHLGRPHLYPIPVAMDAGLQFGDHVTWTAPEQPTASGRGVTALPLIVLSVSPDPKNGRMIAHCLWDVLSQERTATASTGKKAPALKITAATNTSGSTWELTVTSPGDSGFNITSSYGGIFQDLADDGGRVRLVNPTRHNPSATNEYGGMLEASVEVDSVSHVAGVNKITVTIPAAWIRGSVTAAHLTATGNYVLLQNYRPAATNPEGSTITGHVKQGYDSGSGRDFAAFSPVSRKPRFDSRRNLIGA